MDVCRVAREAIEGRRLVGWRGLPADCTSDGLFGVKLEDQWGQRRLGSERQIVSSRLLEWTGYWRPMASVRDGRVVMFDAVNPVLPDGWPALDADLGPPEATLDWWYGAVEMPGGERVYATRGITVFTNRAGSDLLHVALYAPTDVATYQRLLRPELQKKPLR